MLPWLLLMQLGGRYVAVGEVANAHDILLRG